MKWSKTPAIPDAVTLASSRYFYISKHVGTLAVIMWQRLGAATDPAAERVNEAWELFQVNQVA